MKNKEACSDCEQAKKIIQQWLDQQGHNRCWYYPDVFNKLATLFKLSPKKDPELPPRKEFEEGCRKYQEEEFSSR